MIIRSLAFLAVAVIGFVLPVAFFVVAAGAYIVRYVGPELIILGLALDVMYVTSAVVLPHYTLWIVVGLVLVAVMKPRLLV